MSWPNMDVSSLCPDKTLLRSGLLSLCHCDWLGYVHVFEFLEGRVGVVLCWVGVRWDG